MRLKNSSFPIRSNAYRSSASIRSFANTISPNSARSCAMPPSSARPFHSPRSKRSCVAMANIRYWIVRVERSKFGVARGSCAVNGTPICRLNLSIRISSNSSTSIRHPSSISTWRARKKHSARPISISITKILRATLSWLAIRKMRFDFWIAPQMPHFRTRICSKRDCSTKKCCRYSKPMNRSSDKRTSIINWAI